MRQREFIAGLAGAAAWPAAARAQQPERMRFVGVLMGSTDNAEARSRITAFLQALQELGWTEGRNVQVDLRWGGRSYEHRRACGGGWCRRLCRSCATPAVSTAPIAIPARSVSLFIMFPSPVCLRALSPSERVRNFSASATKRVGAMLPANSATSSEMPPERAAFQSPNSGGLKCRAESRRRPGAPRRRPIAGQLASALATSRRNASRALTSSGRAAFITQSRYLKTISEEHFAIDPDKIEEEKKFDGIFVLRTNTDLNPLEAMLCYKQLWTVEQTFRTAKHLFSTRPIFHKLDETIRGHVFCSFLALVLKKALEDRIAALGHSGSWPEIIADLDSLTETEIEYDGKRFIVRSAPRPAASLACGPLGPRSLRPSATPRRPDPPPQRKCSAKPSARRGLLLPLGYLANRTVEDGSKQAFEFSWRNHSLRKQLFHRPLNTSAEDGARAE